jgi:hypothetical protein
MFDTMLEFDTTRILSAQIFLSSMQHEARTILGREQPWCEVEFLAN